MTAPTLIYTNATENTGEPDRFDACYYVLEVPKDTYKEGTVKTTLRINKVSFFALSGKDFDTAS